LDHLAGFFLKEKVCFPELGVACTKQLSKSSARAGMYAIQVLLTVAAVFIFADMMMMIAFIAIKSGLVPLIEGLCALFLMESGEIFISGFLTSGIEPEP